MMRHSSVRHRLSQMVAAAWQPFQWGAKPTTPVINDSWVEWSDNADVASSSTTTSTSTSSAHNNNSQQHLHVAKLRHPTCVSSVVTSSKVLPVGASVKRGEEVAVVEWVELHPFLPVQHRECVSSPCDGRVEYCRDRNAAVMPYQGNGNRANAANVGAAEEDDVCVVVRAES